MKNINAKKLSYQQLEERCRYLEKRWLEELLFRVTIFCTEKQIREFVDAKFTESLAKTLNRKLTKKDLKEGRKIIEEHKDTLKELLEGISK